MAAYTYSDWVGDPYGQQKTSDFSSEKKQNSLLGSLRKFFTRKKTSSRRGKSKKVRKGLYMRSRSEEDIAHGKSAFLRNVRGERSSFHHVSPYGNISPDAMFTPGAFDVGRRQKIANGPQRIPQARNIDDDDTSPFDIPEYTNKQNRPSLQNVFDVCAKTDPDSRHPVPAKRSSRGSTPVRSKHGPVSSDSGHNPYPRTALSHSKQNSHSSDISTSSEANSERPSRIRSAPVRRTPLGGGDSPVSSVSGSESRPAERRQRKLKALNLLDAYQDHPSEHPKAQQSKSKKRGHQKHRRKPEGDPPYGAPLPGMEMSPPFPGYIYPGYAPHGYGLVPGAPPNHMFTPYDISSASNDYPLHYPLMEVEDDRMEVESVPLNVIAEEREEPNNSMPGAPHGFDDFSLY